MARLLIKGGCVLTLARKVPNYPRADVLIEDGVIAELGDGLRARDAEVVDGTDTIVMPGFVDTHRHALWALFRNGGTAFDLDAGHYAPNDVYAATLVSLLGAIEAGITTVVDWAELPAEPSYLEAAFQAHADAGLRTVLAHRTPAGSGVDTREAIEHVAAARPTDTRNRMALGSSDLSRADAARIEGEWAAAREAGLHIHAHAGLTPDDAGVVNDLSDRNLLATDVTLVHGSHLSDADFDAVAAHNAHLAVAVSSEMAGEFGAPPLQKLLDRKIEPGLAVDDERLAPGDMFAQMRMANSVQHAAYFDLKLAGKAGLPNLLTTRDVIRYATEVAATTIGLGKVTGTLEPGKRADLIVIRTDRPNIYPINDAIGAVVWGVDTSNIDWVVVDGHALMRNGELAADVPRARDLAGAAQRRVLAAAGKLAEAGAGDDR